MALGVPRTAVRHGPHRFGLSVAALALVTVARDPVRRNASPAALRGWLADMSRAETGEWRLWVMFEPCGYYRLGGMLEVRYRGELRECPRVSAIEADGPMPTGTWLDADRVVIQCRGPTEPDPCQDAARH